MNLSPWIILFAPFVSAVVIVLITERFKKLSSYISVAAVAISFVFSVAVFFGQDGTASFNWIDLGTFQVKIGYLINDLTKLMLLIVTGVGLLIHIYSIGYMADDRGRSRYFCGLSLFMFSMLGIVLANNFIMMFIFWELVGFSSYLLIGHWFYRPAPPAAANKAFLANRLGDFGFMLGILLVWSASGTVSFDELSGHWSTLGLSPGFMTAAASAYLLRSDRKIGTVSTARLATGRHGGPDSCLCINPRGDNGCSRGFYARPHLLSLRAFPNGSRCRSLDRFDNLPARRTHGDPTGRH